MHKKLFCFFFVFLFCFSDVYAAQDTALEPEEEYYENFETYKLSQITETEVTLPSGETIIIATKGGIYGSSDAVAIYPEYIKIKETKAGSLEKEIYFEINKGRFLKDISVETTQGDIIAKATGEGSSIKLEIQKTSTEPSEIVLSDIIILTEGENKDKKRRSETTLCITPKYMNGNNLFYRSNARSIVLNTRFAAVGRHDGELCYEYSRFAGRLVFIEGTFYCVLNDNVMPLQQAPYTKDGYLMVSLRDLNHAIDVNAHYCNTYRYSPYDDTDRNITWNTEQKTVSIKKGVFTSSFSADSNMISVNRETGAIENITLPIATEMKNDVLYLPLCPSTFKSLLGYTLNVKQNDKTFYIGH